MRLRVNGRDHDLPVRDDETLLDVLRDRLGLTGAKEGCNRGECGTCTVLLDGSPIYACLALAAGCVGDIVTIEGLSTPGSSHPMQEAFVAADAAQCGFCTPGQILAAKALLDQTPRPTDDEIRDWMAGNLCRCGTYPKIVTAIKAAAAAARTP